MLLKVCYSEVEGMVVRRTSWRQIFTAKGYSAFASCN